MRTFVFSLLWTLFSFNVYAQVTLWGGVSDKDKREPLSHVMIMLKGKEDGKIWGFTQTAFDGSFRLHTTLEIVKKASLHFSLMGYKEEICLLTDADEQEFPVVMEMSAVEIKEVTIKAHKIWQQGDTLVYNVASFANEQDRTIGDVLKKMPGIDVKKDGQIYYNGSSINKFYIEGKDLLEGRYGIATNGIPQNEVGRVEVMENHQPIRSLEGFVYSQQAAINLRFKDKSKAKWITTLDGAGGVSTAPEGGLWDVNLFAMLLKSGLQNITTVRSNNIGEGLLQSLRDFSVSPASAETDFIALGIAKIGDLEQERTTFNRSHLISSSSLWGVGESMELKSQIHYLYNRETSNSLLETAYYLPDGVKLIEENEDALSRHNLLSGVVSLESNQEKSYLKNILKINLNWSDTDVLTNGTYGSSQDAHMPSYQVNNSMQWVKRLNKQVLTISSINELNVKPQHLAIDRDEQLYRQHIDLRTFQTQEVISYGWNVNRFVLSIRGGIEGHYRSLESHLAGVPDSLGVMENDLNMGRFQVYSGPEIEYTIGKWKGILSVPMNYYFYDLGKTGESKNDWLISPSLYVNWNYSSRLFFFMNGGWSMKPYLLRDNYQGLILKNYRTLLVGTTEYATGRYASASVGVNYKNPTDGTLGFLNFTRSRSKSPFREMQKFVGDYRVYALQKQNTKSESWLAFGNFSTCVDWMSGVLGTDFLYNKSDATLISENKEIPYHTEMLKIGLYVNSQLFSWFNFNYELSHSIYSLHRGGTEKNTLHGWQHNMMCNIIFSDKWCFQLSGEYYKNEIIKKQYKDMFMTNCKVIFNLNSRWEFTSQFSNILNKKHYSYTVYDGLSSIRQQHTIRGREFLIGFVWR